MQARGTIVLSFYKYLTTYWLVSVVDMNNTKFRYDADFNDLFNVREGVNGLPAYIWMYVAVYGSASLIGTFGNALVGVILQLHKACCL